MTEEGDFTVHVETPQGHVQALMTISPSGRVTLDLQ